MKLLLENNIDVPDFVRRGEYKLSLEKENGKFMHDLSTRKKTIYNIFVLDVFVSELHSYISESETSIPSLEETPNSSPKH